MSTTQLRRRDAQDVVAEPAGRLRPEEWAGGQTLANLYTYRLEQLKAPNVHQDAAATGASS